MTTQDLLYKRAQEILEGGQSLKSVSILLIKEGHSEAAVTEALCRLKLHIYKKRKNRGVIFMIAGGVILLTGFVLTVFLFHANHSFDGVMYGFTLTGTGLLGYGAYEVLH